MARTPDGPVSRRARRQRAGRQASIDLEGFLRTLAAGSSAAVSYPKLLGLGQPDALKLAGMVREGLPFTAVKRFQRNVDLGLADLAELIQVPARTLNRRQEEGRLAADESDRLLRISRLVARAIELFEGHVAGARTWLSTPNPGLGGAAPFDLARTEVGTREVEALIGRLEHGIPS